MVNRYNRDIHHRRSIRLKGHDYSQAGGYFVTVCARDRECLFGEIVNGEMRLNEFGRLVRDEWLRSAEIRVEIELGEYVVMPNHFHGIVIITNNATECSGDKCTGNRPMGGWGDRPVAPTGPQSKSIGALMAGYKSAVTKRINAIRQSPGAPVWQRNYYEHIIRDDADYRRIAEYVADNPHRWAEDTLHPDNVRATNVGATGRWADGTTNVGATNVGATGRSPLRNVTRPGGRDE